MKKFTRMLPSLLTRTDVVLELRDSRLPLTSINRTLEGACLCLHDCVHLGAFCLLLNAAMFLKRPWRCDRIFDEVTGIGHSPIQGVQLPADMMRLLASGTHA